MAWATFARLHRILPLGWDSGALQPTYFSATGLFWVTFLYVNGRIVFGQPDNHVGYTPQQGVFYRLRLEANGSTFTARLSDPSGIHPDFTLTYTDTTFASGGVGLSNDIGQGFFRNVSLEQTGCWQ